MVAAPLHHGTVLPTILALGRVTWHLELIATYGTNWVFYVPFPGGYC